MNKGFSLVELSIVLVILGLLVGGILTGQSLIRAAEMRAGITQFKQYQTAVMLFKDRYFYLPGDMPNATDFWGAAGGNGEDTTCYAVESSDSATCNGNGDGEILNPTGISTAPHYHQEGFRAWQHLANASLVEGSYTGRTDSTTNALARTPGKNVPVSKLGGANGARLTYMIISGATVGYYSERTYDFNVLAISGELTPQELWNIDTKLDDGNPVWGSVIAPKSDTSWALGCTTSTVAATAEYNVTNSDNVCPGIIARID